MTPLAVLALALAPSDGIGPSDGAVLSPVARWHAIEACPRVTDGNGTATAVVVGRKDNFVYLLSAKHAADGRKRQFDFFTWSTYPRPDWTPKPADGLTSAIAAESADADFVLLSVLLPPRPGLIDGTDPPLPTLKLAAPGRRPKAFPFDAVSVGCSGGAAPPTCEKVVIQAKRFARRDRTGGAFYWESNTAPVPGRSGGPLLDADGRVIGLCAAAKETVGYYTHLDEIHAVLKEKGFAWLWEE